MLFPAGLHKYTCDIVFPAFKADVFKHQARAAGIRHQCPGKQSIQANYAGPWAAFPGVYQFFVGDNLYHLAVNNTIKPHFGYWFGVKVKAMANNGLEIIFHQPLAQ